MRAYMEQWLERSIQPTIEKASKGFPVLLLTGPRQVGKTWLLNHIKEPGRRYVTLDDIPVRQLAKTDPAIFFQTYPPPVIIDEVQYAPELFPYIKMYVDSHMSHARHRSMKKGLIWMSGSQQFQLMKGIQESLAGRVAIIDMLGLSYREITENQSSVKEFVPSMDMLPSNPEIKPLNISELFKLIWYGSYPELVTDSSVDRNLFYESYLRTYIERDIRDDIGLTNELKFYNFIRAAAARTGNLLNYADLAKDTDINVKTAKIWLSALERSGMVRLLEPYSSNLNQRIVKTPKLYFLDTGFASWLTRWDTPESLLAGAMNGAILETWVYAEILKSYLNSNGTGNIYFYRDSNQKEIDFLIERNMTLYPIEVKKTASPSLDDTRSFSVLSKFDLKMGTGAVICMTPELLPLDKNTLAIPAWTI